MLLIILMFYTWSYENLFFIYLIKYFPTINLHFYNRFFLSDKPCVQKVANKLCLLYYKHETVKYVVYTGISALTYSWLFSNKFALLNLLQESSPELYFLYEIS